MQKPGRQERRRLWRLESPEVALSTTHRKGRVVLEMHRMVVCRMTGCQTRLQALPSSGQGCLRPRRRLRDSGHR